MIMMIKFPKRIFSWCWWSDRILF